MEFLKNNFDIQSSDELSDIAESTIQSGRNQKIENILAQINSKLEKMPAEERKEYLQKLRDRIDMTIIKKEKKLFEADSTDKEDEFDFGISMLKPLEDDEEKIIDSSLQSDALLPCLPHHKEARLLLPLFPTWGEVL